MFVCEWHCGGSILARFECDGRPAGVVGVYTNSGAFVKPDEESAALAAPYRVRAMVQRSSGFWSYDRPGHNGRDVFTMDICTAKGEPRGSILARLAPEYQANMEGVES
jgi:hypothetical protein